MRYHGTHLILQTRMRRKLKRKSRSWTRMEMLCRSKPANSLHVASEFRNKALELVECCRGLCEAILKPFFWCLLASSVLNLARLFVGRFCVSRSAKDMFGEPP